MPEKSLTELIKQYQKRDAYIEKYLSEYDSSLIRLQKELTALILTEYSNKFEVDDDGFLKQNEKNGRLITELDKTFKIFKDQFTTNFFKGTAEAMLSLTAYTSEYFRMQNFNSKTVSNITDKLDKMRFSIGLDAKGKVIEGSYIDRLAQSNETKSQLADYTRKQLEGRVSFEDFTKGFKTIIEGTPQTNGALQKYVGNYVHDAMYFHARAVDNFFGEELGLKYFLYQGDEMVTTRPFCHERFGRYFEKKEGESWNNEDWQGKIPDIDFFQQAGGYNCRHRVMWVDKLYFDKAETVPVSTYKRKTKAV